MFHSDKYDQKLKQTTRARQKLDECSHFQFLADSPRQSDEGTEQEYNFIDLQILTLLTILKRYHTAERSLPLQDLPHIYSHENVELFQFYQTEMR